ncbi:MAG TPA: alpha-amylase/4-alpha-glucanotransferase domain-containing protein [bacterium]|nr:alpha-amylase/4-alpha-glucanotransferase domain-containing protein [bacterium]
MIPFLFAVHSHQPVGNFGWVFEKAFAESYEPFLELLAEYPEVRVGLHYSGCLLEWIEDHRPAHVDLLKSLTDRGQVEIIGGGYYEPIFSAIPERDARAQVQTYFDHLEAVFGRRPAGLWLTERVWDTSLPALFHDLGVKYTLVDDSHFRYAGLAPEDVWGPFIAEREGKGLVIFPIDQKLRYMIPFHEPEDSIAHIRERAEKHEGFVACYGDDGEKFGVWPDTHEWVFEKGWLERFFRALTDAKDEIRTALFSDYLEGAEPRGRVYLPPASYEEMMEWVLPPALGRRLEDLMEELKEEGRWDELAPFVRGGHWDMFLGKYEEANRMQKRMLLCSSRIADRKDAPPEARRALYRSQCNCAYWHGVFGGLYLNFLRHALYREMLEAEALAGLNQGLTIERKDYDVDGYEEILVSAAGINAIVSPRLGGSIVALEYPQKRFSIGNVLGRREETYHGKLAQAAAGQDADTPKTIHERVAAKEEGLEKFLVYDRFPRVSLQDHLTSPGITLEQIEKEQAPELSSLAGARYQAAVDHGRVTLSRESACGEATIKVEKTLRFKADRAGFTADYRIRADRSAGGPPANAAGQRPAPQFPDGKLSARFGVEFNLTLLAGDEPERHYLLNGARPENPTMIGRGAHEDVTSLELVNGPDGFAARIRASAPARLFRFPVEAVSQSESGFERTYQGSCLWLTWPLKLAAGESWSVALDFDFLER